MKFKTGIDLLLRTRKPMAHLFAPGGVWTAICTLDQEPGGMTRGVYVNFGLMELALTAPAEYLRLRRTLGRYTPEERFMIALLLAEEGQEAEAQVEAWRQHRWPIDQYREEPDAPPGQ